MAEKIQCELHGEASRAFVCIHLSGQSVGLGFNSDEPMLGNQYPDAWCDVCERIRVAHGGWNDESESLTKMEVCCSACYQRSRIRNTRTNVTLDDLSGFRWKCGTCDEWHTGPCLDFGHAAPLYWTKDHEEKSKHWSGLRKLAGKQPKTFLDKDYCAINGEHFYVRGLIQLPILGRTQNLCWGVWGSPRRENFEKLREMGGNAERTKVLPMFSWLSNNIPEYPETLNLKMHAHIQKPGLRPLFELEPVDHPLAKEFHEGISPERVREIMMKMVREFEGQSC